MKYRQDVFCSVKLMASVTDRTPPVEFLKLRQDLAGHVNEKSDLP